MSTIAVVDAESAHLDWRDQREASSRMENPNVKPMRQTLKFANKKLLSEKGDGPDHFPQRYMWRLPLTDTRLLALDIRGKTCVVPSPRIDMKTLTLAALWFGMIPGFASAQSCATPGGPINPGDLGMFAGSGDTCSGGAIDEFGAVCGGGIISGGPSDVYRMNLGTPNNFWFIVTPSGGYDAALYFVGPGACLQTTACPPGGDSDTAGPNGSETVSFTGLPAGTYFVVIDSTSLGSTAPACGPYTLSLIGTELPVSLRNFSVD